MSLWQGFAIGVGATILFIFLWSAGDLWARSTVNKRHKKGRSQGKTDEEIAQDYLNK